MLLSIDKKIFLAKKIDLVNNIVKNWDVISNKLTHILCEHITVVNLYILLD